MSNWRVAIPVCLFFVALMTSAGEAHPRLKQAEPAPGSVVAKSPAAIRLTFSMPMEARFSRIQLLNSAGQAIPVAATIIDARDAKRIIAALPTRLAPGGYTVEWRAVGVDTHWQAGIYRFTIKE